MKCVSVCLSVCLSVCMYDFMYVLSVCMSVCTVCLYVLSVCLSVYLSVCLSVCTVSLSVCMYVCMYGMYMYVCYMFHVNVNVMLEPVPRSCTETKSHRPGCVVINKINQSINYVFIFLFFPWNGSTIIAKKPLVDQRKYGFK